MEAPAAGTRTRPITAGVLEHSERTPVTPRDGAPGEGNAEARLIASERYERARAVLGLRIAELTDEIYEAEASERSSSAKRGQRTKLIRLKQRLSPADEQEIYKVLGY
jgi:hypothetical protein